jgi:putative ABC transport system permease protein
MFGFRIQRTIRSGLRSLWLHKLRSTLTALGIILGVGSVILMLAIGEGATQEALEKIRRLGSENIILNSVKPPEERSAAIARTFTLTYGLTYLDAERIQDTIPNVEVIVPSRETRLSLWHFNKCVDGRIVGTVPWYPQIANREMVRGRFLTSVDMERLATVCVLNEPVAAELFPFQDPLGKVVRAGRDCYQVVGILRAQPMVPGQDPVFRQASSGLDAYIPMTTARARYGDVNFRRATGSMEATRIQLSSIIVKVPTLQDVVPTSRAVERVLKYGHEKRDYEVVVPLQLLETERQTKQTLKLFLASIAVISLLVGGIGIMNIMLATVTERTREIGVRRALGARRRDVVTQFLTEAILLSAGGGLLGVAIGVAVPYVFTLLTGQRTVVTVESCAVAFSFSVGTGLIFGIYPAYRAATMDPIEALRHE